MISEKERSSLSYQNAIVKIGGDGPNNSIWVPCFGVDAKNRPVVLGYQRGNPVQVGIPQNALIDPRGWANLEPTFRDKFGYASIACDYQSSICGVIIPDNFRTDFCRDWYLNPNTFFKNNQMSAQQNAQILSCHCKYLTSGRVTVQDLIRQPTRPATQLSKDHLPQQIVQGGSENSSTVALCENTQEKAAEGSSGRKDIATQTLLDRPGANSREEGSSGRKNVSTQTLYYDSEDLVRAFTYLGKYNSEELELTAKLTEINAEVKLLESDYQTITLSLKKLYMLHTLMGTEVAYEKLGQVRIVQRTWFDLELKKMKLEYNIERLKLRRADINLENLSSGYLYPLDGLYKPSYTKNADYIEEVKTMESLEKSFQYLMDYKAKIVGLEYDVKLATAELRTEKDLRHDQQKYHRIKKLQAKENWLKLDLANCQTIKQDLEEKYLLQKKAFTETFAKKIHAREKADFEERSAPRESVPMRFTSGSLDSVCYQVIGKPAREPRRFYQTLVPVGNPRLEEPILGSSFWLGSVWFAFVFLAAAFLVFFVKQIRLLEISEQLVFFVKQIRLLEISEQKVASKGGSRKKNFN